MFIIFGILAMIAVFAEEYILGAFFNFTIMGFSVWFLPIGALMIGAFVGVAMSKGFCISNKRLKARGVLLCALFGAITFVGINYMEYKTTYVKEGQAGEFSVNRNFEGSPISDFVMDKDGQEVKITFINFVKSNLEENDATYRMKGGREVSVDSSGTLNYVMFVIQILVLIIGAAAGSVYCIPSHFCDACKKYHTEKEIFQIEDKDINSILIDDNTIVDDKLELVNFINNHKQKIKQGTIYTGVVSYCKQCSGGKLIIKKSYIKGNEKKEDSAAQKTIDIERSVVESLLQS